ncbi:MAG: hypothetical protein M3P48_11625, partial [Actinomycetota bacterium]|nr:hypothetical protein [Actinomycetota bacterium]
MRPSGYDAEVARCVPPAAALAALGCAVLAVADAVLLPLSPPALVAAASAVALTLLAVVTRQRRVPAGAGDAAAATVVAIVAAVAVAHLRALPEA